MPAPRAKFLMKGSTPPIGYVYSIEHEGNTYRFQASMFSELMRQLKLWHREKDVEWPGDTEMQARIEDFICQLVPPSFCKGGPKSPRVPFLSISSIRDATRLFTSRLREGGDILVDKNEAERRAKICANCPANLHGICVSCAGSEFTSILRAFLTRGAVTKYDSVLDTCQVCGCLLQAKVHVSLDVLGSLRKRKYPANCWLHNTGAHTDED